MTYPSLLARQRRTWSVHVVGLVALCGLVTCDKKKAGGGDASPALPDRDASSSAVSDDAFSDTSGSDASSTAASVDASSSLSASNFPVTFADTVCPSIATCCQQAGLDSSSCQDTLQATLAAWVTKNTSDPKVTFDLGAAARCIEVTRAAFAACTDRELAQQSSSPCKQMARGTVAIGDSCTGDSQCAPPTGGTPLCSAGVCMVGPPSASTQGPHAALGAPCDGTCGQSGCSWSGSSSLPALCWTDDGLYCPTGVCVATPAIGQPCSFYCGKDAHCADDGRCAPNQATGPCALSGDCLSQSYCYRPDTTVPGQCTLLKENGAACSFAKECASGQCLNATCHLWIMASDKLCSGVFSGIIF